MPSVLFTASEQLACAAAQFGGNLRVVAGQSGATVDDEHDDVGFEHGLARLARHQRFDARPWPAGSNPPVSITMKACSSRRARP